jgi:hypothetical protein
MTNADLKQKVLELASALEYVSPLCNELHNSEWRRERAKLLRDLVNEAERPVAVDDEREACAKICEDLPLEIDTKKWSTIEDQYVIRVAEAGCRNAFADAIRARSEDTV